MNATFELIESGGTGLTLRRAGKGDVKDVRIRRAFPWPSPNQFISIRSSDGKELLLIESLAGLAPDLRRTIEQQLAETILIPRITRVEEIDVRFGFQEWHVQTDRGPVQFRVQEREDIRFLPDGRYSIRDAEGQVYELPPRQTLDEHSRKALEPLI